MTQRGARDLDDCLGLSAIVQSVLPEPRSARMRPSFCGRTERGEHAQLVSRGAPAPTGSRDRLLAGVPGPNIERILGAAPGDAIGRGKFDRPESSAALAANASGSSSIGHRNWRR